MKNLKYSRHSHYPASQDCGVATCLCAGVFLALFIFASCREIYPRDIKNKDPFYKFKGKTLQKTIINEYGNKIEFIFENNDTLTITSYKYPIEIK